MTAPLSPPVIDWISIEILPHEPALRAFLRRFCRGRLDVDDIVQETYSRLATSANILEIRNPKAYMFTAARNVAQELLRRERIVQIDFVAEIERLSINDTEPSVEDAYTAREELGFIWETIEALPRQCRKIFMLRKIDGVSQREIASRLGVTENVVEHQSARAMRAILARIAQRDGTPPRIAKRRARREPKKVRAAD